MFFAPNSKVQHNQTTGGHPNNVANQFDYNIPQYGPQFVNLYPVQQQQYPVQQYQQQPCYNYYPQQQHYMQQQQLMQNNQLAHGADKASQSSEQSLLCNEC